ncbi:MAG TPA: DUF4124 domain-containing protein, partial [Gammaproteobacteria bacterium]
MMPPTSVPPRFKLAPVLLSAALFACSFSAQADEIFKYVAADGTVTYSAFKPRSGSFEKLEPSCLL